MSKFFKALEHAERERAREQAGDVALDERATATATAPLPDPPPDLPPDRPVVAPPMPRHRSEPPIERAPRYGAPLSRPANGTHESAFSALLEPAPMVDPGRIDDHLVSLLEPTSLAAEQYRSVRLAIENFRRERGLQLVAIASPGRGDGRTMTAINVAGAMAQATDARVVLVEADLRHPSMAQALGLGEGHGLSTYLLDPALHVDPVVTRPPGLGFAVVTAGSASSMPYEMLASPRLGALLAELRERFDYVVVDTPPALPFPDVGILRDLVDGFVIVIRANRTPREQVRESLQTIGPQRVLGAIFNDDERTGAPRRRRRSLLDYLERPWGGVRAA